MPQAQTEAKPTVEHRMTVIEARLDRVEGAIAEIAMPLFGGVSGKAHRRNAESVMVAVARRDREAQNTDAMS